MVRYYEDGFMITAKELLDKGLHPRIRLYRVSSNGLKMRALAEVSVRDVEDMTDNSIGMYALNVFGSGYYCAKLFSTRYGRNILEHRYDFAVGRIEDEEDEEDEEDF
jgi:hypothetical protein